MDSQFSPNMPLNVIPGMPKEIEFTQKCVVGDILP